MTGCVWNTILGEEQTNYGEVRMKNVTRRGFLFRVGGAAGAISLAGAGKLFSQTRQEEAQEEEISPAEDLMREHGLLRRILLIYEEWIKRLRSNKGDQVDTLAESTRIIRTFVEDYHEQLEEKHLFPRFRKAGKLVDLVNVLLQQHQAGRKLTDEVLKLSNAESLRTVGNRKRLSRFLSDFTRMYGPHAAREDTVLFPAFHEIVPAKEYGELGDAFEKRENEMFGEQGFEKMVDRVASLEKKLGLYELSRFTPRL
jgi:hemerythrin-like domain-containing protein